ncbi:hypothetical protein V1264_001778 [Littorina saxatilis]|uniref:Uncharacterized protein n=2 Tax=Littorina saxatilis TaxID=31220 RepID=A0AAN9C298_9CAEN
MRKRILSMRPGCQVSASMHPDTTQTPRMPSPAPVPMTPRAAVGAPPLLRAPAATLLAAPRMIASNRERGTLSVIGPDNTVIMFNSALGESLPLLHEQRPFFSPLPAGEQRLGANEVRGGGSDGGSERRDDLREERAALPTITSPNKNIQRGSFAGLLTKSHAASSASDASPTCAVPEEVRVGGDGEENFPSTPPRAPPAQPLMSDDTINALFEQICEGRGDGGASVGPVPHSLLQASPDLLTKAMHGAEISPGGGCQSEYLPESPTKTGSQATCSAVSHSVEWTKEQDKVILETVRDHGDSQDTCTQIATQLHPKTPHQVADRLSTLMELLNAMEDDPDTDEAEYMDV